MSEASNSIQQGLYFVMLMLLVYVNVNADPPPVDPPLECVGSMGINRVNNKVIGDSVYHAKYPDLLSSWISTIVLHLSTKDTLIEFDSTWKFITTVYVTQSTDILL